jgi:hypothetical protein
VFGGQHEERGVTTTQPGETGLGGNAGESAPTPVSRTPLSHRILLKVIGSPRPGESDVRFGVRLALYGPIAFYVFLWIGLIVLQVDGESGLGLTLMYWLFIGVSQLVYLIPCIVAAFVVKRPGVAWGMVRGAGVIAALDGVAWLIGYYVIGAR